jgi:hypothetical protein
MKAPLNKYTFRSKKIKVWVERELEGYVLNLFAGPTKLDWSPVVTNDLDKACNPTYNMDALKFCEWYSSRKIFKQFDTVLLDPPYSYRKSMEMYKGNITSPFNALKDCITKMIPVGGIVITFGYHSNVMGKGRGFKQDHILLISHGGAIHDTIATIEIKEREL